MDTTVDFSTGAALQIGRLASVGTTGAAVPRRLARRLLLLFYASSHERRSSVRRFSLCGTVRTTTILHETQMVRRRRKRPCRRGRQSAAPSPGKVGCPERYPPAAPTWRGDSMSIRKRWAQWCALGIGSGFALLALGGCPYGDSGVHDTDAPSDIFDHTTDPTETIGESSEAVSGCVVYGQSCTTTTGSPGFCKYNGFGLYCADACASPSYGTCNGAACCVGLYGTSCQMERCDPCDGAICTALLPDTWQCIRPNGATCSASCCDCTGVTCTTDSYGTEQCHRSDGSACADQCCFD